MSSSAPPASGPAPFAGESLSVLQSRLRSALLRSAPDTHILSLLASKASPTAPLDDEGGAPTLPLVLACRKGRARLAQLLLSAGADPAAADEAGVTPLRAALRRGKAARKVAGLLVAAGAAEGMTEEEVVRKAVEEGADEGDNEENNVGNLDTEEEEGEDTD